MTDDAAATPPAAESTDSAVADETTVEGESGEETTTEGEETTTEEGEESTKDDDELPEVDDILGEKTEEATKEDDEEGVNLRETRKKIEAKYPNIFKEFPHLRAALFKSQEIYNIFPSMDDAREASDKAVALDRISESVMTGDPTKFFDSVAASSPEALSELVANFLPTLAERSQPLYLKAADYGIKHFIRAAFNHGDRSKDINLKRAAQHIANFYSGSPDMPELPTNGARNNEENPEVKRLRGELSDRDRRQYSSYRGDIAKDGKAKAMTLISKTLDPNNAFPELVRRGLLKEAFEEISDLLESDEEHNSNMNRLWKSARDRGLPAELKPRILSAYLGRVRAALAGVRHKYRAQGLKAVPAAGERGEQPTKKDVTGGPSSGKLSKLPASAKDIDWSKTSDQDILDAAINGKGKITLRK